MAKKNLTKEQIHEATVFQLIFRLETLHALGVDRSRDAGIPLPDIWEAKNIELELKKRLARIMIFTCGAGNGN